MFQVPKIMKIASMKCQMTVTPWTS